MDTHGFRQGRKGIFAPAGPLLRASGIVLVSLGTLASAGCLFAGSEASEPVAAAPEGQETSDSPQGVRSGERLLTTGAFAFATGGDGGKVSHPPASVFHVLGSTYMARMATRIAAACERVDAKYQRLGWGVSPCLSLPWRFEHVSERGEPLLYWEYVGPATSKRDRTRSETTLILGGVHPDELTPIHLVFRFAEALHRDPSLYADRRVVVAPLVNPDGFYTLPARRTNANGVDLNRNFPTTDWWAKATAYWKKAKAGGDPRRFPGFAPLTEEGTRFQVALIERHEPDKVLSVHAPLGFLDYDGPGDKKPHPALSEHEKRARELASVIARNSSNYGIRDYQFYPGSLGNFSGNDRSIPTITVELDTSDPKRVGKYWKEFFPGLQAALRFEFSKSVLAKLAQREEKKRDE